MQTLYLLNHPVSPSAGHGEHVSEKGLLSGKEPFCWLNPDEPLLVKQAEGRSLNPEVLYWARDRQLESEFGMTEEDKSRKDLF